MAVRTASPALRTRVGRVYQEAWRTYRAHPAALLVPGAVLFALFGVPSALLSDTTTDDGVLAVLLSSGAQTLGFVSSFLYYGYCEEVADQAREGAVSVRRALKDTRGVVLKLIAVTVLAEALVGLSILIPLFPALLLELSTATVVVILVIVLCLLLIAVPILLLVRWALVAPIASFERVWPIRAMRRSRELSRGNFRFVVLTAVVMFVLEQIVSTVFDHLGATVFSHETIGAALGDAIGDLLIAPWAGLVIAIAYFRLSGRREAALASGGEA